MRVPGTQTTSEDTRKQIHANSGRAAARVVDTRRWERRGKWGMDEFGKVKIFRAGLYVVGDFGNFGGFAFSVNESYWFLSAPTECRTPWTHADSKTSPKQQLWIFCTGANWKPLKIYCTLK